MHHNQPRQSADPESRPSLTREPPNLRSNTRGTDAWVVPEPADIPELTHDQLSEHLRLAQINRAHYAAVADALQAELVKRSPTDAYQCMKCGHQRYQLNQIRTARTGLSAFFGVETAQYQAVVCARCKFTEFYQGSVPLGQQVLDAVFGR